MSDHESLTARSISPKLTMLLSVAAGATVANLYYSQPLLQKISTTWNVSAAAVTSVSFATQLGYAAGLLFLVPLGDSFERRRLIVIATSVVVATLLLVAASRNLPWLAASSFLLGAATIVPQLVVPYAATLARPDERGRVIGVVMSGLLVGVILSRTVSGFVGAYAGWRVTYVIAAIVSAILALVLRVALPEQHPEHDALRYRDLLRSLGTLVRTQPVLRRHALVGACGFAAFSVFWTSLAFHLAELSPRYGTQMVGAFGLIGVSGALAAPFAGRFADRTSPAILNGTALAIIVIGYVVMALGGHSLFALAAGVVLLDAGAQSSHISNQTRIFALDAALRNRLNAVYMVAYFLGGALGSAVAGAAWQHFGWMGVCGAGAAFAAMGIVALRAR